MTTHLRNFSLDRPGKTRPARRDGGQGRIAACSRARTSSSPRRSRRCLWRAGSPKQAYKAGAGLVTPILSDEEMTLARFRFAPEASFDRAPGWLYEGVAKAFAANTARLAIVGEDPMLLAERGPRQGRARQQGELDRLSAGFGKNRRLRHQLEHRRLSDRSPGRSGSFPERRTTSPSASWRRRSSPPRGSITTIRSPPGRRITRPSAAGRNG